MWFSLRSGDGMFLTMLAILAPSVSLMGLVLPLEALVVLIILCLPALTLVYSDCKHNRISYVEYLRTTDKHVYFITNIEKHSLFMRIFCIKPKSRTLMLYRDRFKGRDNKTYKDSDNELFTLGMNNCVDKEIYFIAESLGEEEIMKTIEGV